MWCLSFSIMKVLCFNFFSIIKSILDMVSWVFFHIIFIQEWHKHFVIYGFSTNCTSYTWQYTFQTPEWGISAYYVTISVYKSRRPYMLLFDNWYVVQDNPWNYKVYCISSIVNSHEYMINHHINAPKSISNINVTCWMCHAGVGVGWDG